LRLDQLLDAVPVVEILGDHIDVEVLDVTNASGAVRPGALFCCLPGAHVDGHDFAAAAVGAGAVALLVERPVEQASGVPQVVVRPGDARPAMAELAAAVNGHPSRHLDVVGVTGTNGKTTTAVLLHSILEASGQRAGLLGTMTGARTTPESPELQRRLAGFLAEGCTAAAIEVSSVGLASHRVDAVHFAVGVFTNLSQDHLDDHGSMEAYFAAKATLFEPGRAAVGVVNADDDYGRRLLSSARIPMRPFSMSDVEDVDLGVGASTFTWRGTRIRLALDGAFNVANAVAAATAAAELGISLVDIGAGLAAVQGVTGRTEPIDAGQEFRVVVDYAHTPLALEKVLEAARHAAGDGGRVIVVFGCGGDRDPTKRAPMGWAASSAADLVVVTSDNPRSEDPDRIIAAIVDGATGGAQVIVEPDRRAAIAVAIARASAGDVVVIAGKGHETGQIVGDTIHDFDDRLVARELLEGIHS